MRPKPGEGGRPEVATLGEALVVMDPVAPGPLRYVEGFRKRVGGAELNVAVGLARLGRRASWAGRLGEDEFGAEVLAFLRGEGVDVSGVSLDPGAPTGVYFKEQRALGALRVYYYRAYSAASRTRFENLELEQLLSAEVLHLTGDHARPIRGLPEADGEPREGGASAAPSSTSTSMFGSGFSGTMPRERT